MTTRRNIGRAAAPALAAIALALGVSACGASDEEQVRSAAGDLMQALDKKDGGRACKLMTPRAQAQYTTLLSLFGGGGTCRQLVTRLDSDDDERLTRRDIDGAKVTVRGDVAILTPKKDDSPVGLRRTDGNWRVDNVLNPSLRSQVPGDPRLARGSDRQQIRATVTAVKRALVRRNFARLCTLIGYRAESYVLVGAAFAGALSGGDEDSEISCPAAFRVISSLADDKEEEARETGEIVGELPSRQQLAAAKIAVRGGQATVALPGHEPLPMVRIDGRWRVEAAVADSMTPAEYERCWRRAGARIASDPGDLRFAASGTVRHISITTGHVSTKGKDWRIFYTLPDDGDDPGLAAVVHDPDTVAAVAYVKRASAQPDVVARARACGE